MQPLVRWHRPLLVTAAAMAALAVVALVGLFVDDRTFQGAPVWAKAMKFGISTSVYMVTMAWLLSLSRKALRFCWWLGTAVAVTLGIEIVLVVVQVVRAEPSHFGAAYSPWGHIVGRIMGDTIMVFLLVTLLLGIVLASRRLADRPTRTAIRAGLAISLAGMLTGFLMFADVTPEQQRLLEHDQPTLLGGHSVGVADGGPSLPVTYWSTTGGDLRIPHFVGLHSLQVLPLLALGLLLLARRVRVLHGERTRVALMRVLSLGYAGFFGLVLWQALRGQPLVAPDALTLGTLAGLVAVIGLGCVAVALTVGRREVRDRVVSDSLAESVDSPIAV